MHAPYLDAAKIFVIVGSNKNVEDLVRLHVQLASGLDIAHEPFPLSDFDRCGVI